MGPGTRAEINAFIPVRGFHRILVWLLSSSDYCANVPIVNQKGKCFQEEIGKMTSI